MNYFSLSGLLIFFTSLIISIIIIRYGKTRVQKNWLLFNLCVCFWGVASFYIGKSTTPEQGANYWKIAAFPVILSSVFIYYTVWFICEIKKKKFLTFVYIQAGIFCITNVFDFFYTGVRPVFQSFYYPTAGIIFNIFALLWFFINSYCIYILIKAFKQTTGIKQKQISYLLVGFASVFIGAGPNFLPVYKIDIYPYANFLMVINPLVGTYAIFRYRLLDLSIILTRFAIFVALSFLSFGIPMSFFYLNRELLIESWGLKLFLIILIFFTSMLGMILILVYMLIQKRAVDRILYNQRKYQKTLLKASKNMTLIKDINKLLHEIVKSITELIDINYCAVYLFNEKENKYDLTYQKPELVKSNLSISSDEQLINVMSSSRKILIKEEIQLKGESLQLVSTMERYQASILTPVFMGNSLLGFLVIGDKKSGKAYNEGDIEAFSTMANYSAIAIENAIFLIKIEQTQATLFQTAKMSSMGTLASGMGHQIHNRLQAIRLLVDAINAFYSMNDVQKIKEYLKMIIENIDLAKNIIETLRDHARPSSGEYIFLKLKTVIDKSIQMVKLKKGSKFNRIKMEINIPSEVPGILGDRSQLQEVFFNLIDNADDAIEEAQQTIYKNKSYYPTIKINVLHTNNEERFIHITIEDNGIGISEENLKKLFVPFHTTKATVQGTGLGLYVVDKIVRGAHGGDITVKSKYGYGTKFILSLKKA